MKQSAFFNTLIFFCGLEALSLVLGMLLLALCFSYLRVQRRQAEQLSLLD